MTDLEPIFEYDDGSGGKGMKRLNDIGRRHYAEVRRETAKRGREDVHTFTASEALRRARLYQETHTGRDLQSGHGPIWRALGGSDGETREDMRWIERPASKGLRLVGLVHEIQGSGVEHRGWFTDHECCLEEQVVVGVVYRLPTRKGQARFIAGHTDPYNDHAAADTPARIMARVFANYAPRNKHPIETCSQSRALWNACRAAESVAERDAEEARAYERREHDIWCAGNHAAQLRDDWREALRDYVAEARALRTCFRFRHSAPPWPLGRTVKDAVARVRGAREKVNAARSEYDGHMKAMGRAKGEAAFAEGYRSYRRSGVRR